LGSAVAADLTPAEYSLSYAAKAIIAELTCPGLDTECSLEMIRKTVLGKIKSAQVALSRAQSQAENHDQAQPEDESADRWCGWCGATAPDGGLEDDGVIRLTGERIADPAWFCANTPACIARRRVRYPDRKTPELAQALQELVLAQDAAAPAILALTAYTAATRQAQAPEGTVVLTSSRMPAQPRPGLLSREQQQARRFAHTLSNPANRHHLISRPR
jgi:hypothetical protein